MNYEEVKVFIQENETKKIAVVMTSIDCTKCEKISEYVNESLISKYPDIEFVNLETEEIPVFAPAVLPSIIFFKRGVRSHEGHGLPEPLNAIDNVIDWWLTQTI